ncbi:unnamed protein product [Heligmosomoides polygyrus]|uniref:Uncharacterized protein n=1 Tax=Heligmosomoides polygyrus TaxID=6339 RepID=A0A3P7UR15_HELPZ|nr:unnamed protein product [Heligmosomoides polygyrus]
MPNPSQTSSRPNFFGPNSFNFGPLFGKGNSFANHNANNDIGKQGTTNFADGNTDSFGGSSRSFERYIGSGQQWSNTGSVGAEDGRSNRFHGATSYGDLSLRTTSPEAQPPPFVFQPNFLSSTPPTTSTKNVPMPGTYS